MKFCENWYATTYSHVKFNFNGGLWSNFFSNSDQKWPFWTIFSFLVRNFTKKPSKIAHFPLKLTLYASVRGWDTNRWFPYVLRIILIAILPTKARENILKITVLCSKNPIFGQKIELLLFWPYFSPILMVFRIISKPEWHAFLTIQLCFFH